MTGRPRSFDRDAALNVALEHFWLDGYSHTSIATLTAAMGVRPPSLYAAFGDKEQLFGECTARYLQDLNTGLAAALGEPTARAAIDQLLHQTAIAHTDPATPPGCLVYNEPTLRPHRLRVHARVADRLERARTEGDLPPDIDPSSFADFVDTVLAGMAAKARDGATTDDLLAVADQAMATWPA